MRRRREVEGGRGEKGIRERRRRRRRMQEGEEEPGHPGGVSNLWSYGPHKVVGEHKCQK